MDVFTAIRPDSGVDVSQVLSVAETDFSDGYQQIVPIGINYKKLTRSITWTAPYDDLDEMYAFLMGKEKIAPFLYTYPDDIQRQYRVKDVKFKDGRPNQCILSCTMTENFDIV